MVYKMLEYLECRPLTMSEQIFGCKANPNMAFQVEYAPYEDFGQWFCEKLQCVITIVYVGY